MFSTTLTVYLEVWMRWLRILLYIPILEHFFKKLGILTATLFQLVIVLSAQGRFTRIHFK